tara:strand:+ start:3304 stop:3963 length:660 start_codon:yes stop_codon:yes gene_type:complete
MQNHEIISNYDDFINTLVLSNPFQTAGYGKTVTVRTRSGMIPVMKVEEMYCPFGLSQYNGKFSLDMSIKDPELLKFLKALDNRLMHMPNKEEDWLGGIKPVESLKSLYVPLVKESKPVGKYPPSLKGTVLLNDVGKNKATALFDNERKLLQLTESNLPKGSRCSGLLSIGSIWIIQNRFGLSAKFKQIKRADSVIPQPKVGLNDYAFVEDSDSDDDTMS